MKRLVFSSIVHLSLVASAFGQSTSLAESYAIKHYGTDGHDHSIRIGKIWNHFGQKHAFGIQNHNFINHDTIR